MNPISGLKNLVMSRVSFFDLEDGKVYAAIDKSSGRRLNRTFYKKDGRLYNDSNREAQGTYRGCAYVPASEAYHFEEIQVADPKIEEVAPQNEFNVTNMKEGMVYKWQQGYLSGHNFVLREKDVMFFCDAYGNKGARVRAEKVSLADKFEPVAEIPKKATVQVEVAPETDKIPVLVGG